jgi:hypothetical protein
VNPLGQLVAALLIAGILLAIVAGTRGRVDGAALLSFTLIFFAAAITAWAANNRKQNRP